MKCYDCSNLLCLYYITGKVESFTQHKKLIPDAQSKEGGGKKPG